MNEERIPLLAARIIGKCAIAYLKSKGENTEAQKLQVDIETLMETYGANLDIY